MADRVRVIDLPFPAVAKVVQVVCRTVAMMGVPWLVQWQGMEPFRAPEPDLRWAQPPRGADR